MFTGPRFFRDVAGTIEGTDKTSVHTLRWGYLTTYETLFAEWRDEPISADDYHRRRLAPGRGAFEVGASVRRPVASPRTA